MGITRIVIGKSFAHRIAVAHAAVLLLLISSTAAAVEDDFLTIDEGGATPAGFNVVDNDDFGFLDRVTVETEPQHAAQFSLTSQGVLTYVHDGSETVSDSFRYRVSSILGGPTESATVNITIRSVNDPPTITGQTPNPLPGTEDQSFQIELSNLQITDPDSDDFSLEILPGDGYSVQGDNIVPEKDRDGRLTVNVRVSDEDDDDDGGEVSDTFLFQVELASVNDPPVFDGPIPAQTAEEDQSVNFDVSGFFSDVDSELRFEASGLPPRLSISNDGRITGTPRADSVGDFNVTVTARESGGPGSPQSVAGTFSFTVLKKNTPPRLVSAIPDQEAFEGEPFSFNVTPHFDDDDLGRGDALTFSASGLPAGLGINATSGVISGTPSAAVVREQPYQVRVTATDSEDETASDTFALTIQTRNTPPELETPIPDQQAVEGSPFSLDTSNHFVDPDEGDDLSFSATGLPASLGIDEASGVISGTPTPAEARDAPYQVTVTATDERGQTASDTFALTVVQRDRANLALDVEATPSPALLADSLTLRFTVSNDGPSPAPESGFEADVIGSDPALVPASGSNCVTAAIDGGQRLSCTLGQLDAGGSRTVTVELSTAAAGDVAIFAEAAVAGAEPIDPTPSDNQVRLSVGIAEAFSGGALRMLGPASVLSLAAGDLDGDGNVDIVAGTELGEPLSIWFGAGDRDFGQPLELPVQSATTGVAVADLDGDDDLDLVVVTAGGDQNRVYLNGGSRDFSAGSSLGSDDARGVVIADFDGDAAPDIAIASAARDSVWINRGGGNFDLALQFPPGESDGIAAGDVAGDALPDLVVASRTGPDLFHRNISSTGSISFAPPVEVNDGASAGVAIGDVDGDGRSDLVFAAVPAEFRDLAANPRDKQWRREQRAG